MDIEHLRGWIGRSEVRAQDLALFPADAMAGLLDRPDRAQIGPDGHPRKGGFLPPVPLERRVWAAGDLRIHQPLIIGRPARRISRVADVDLKGGKSGPLVFVTVHHEVPQDEVCLSEEQTIAYRAMPAGPVPLPPGETPATPAAWSATLTPDQQMLFQFAALTYNGHRIHVDRDYATSVEFYPGLVVHGPLLATLLLDLLYRQHPGAMPTRFSFRAIRPVFDGRPLTLAGRTVDQGAELWTVDDDGHVGMTAIIKQ